MGKVRDVQLPCICLLVLIAGCDTQPSPPSAGIPTPSSQQKRVVQEFKFNYDAEYAALWDAKASTFPRLPENPPYRASKELQVAYLEGYQRALDTVTTDRGVKKIVDFVRPENDKDRARIEGYLAGQAAGHELERAVAHEVHELMMRRRSEWTAR